MFVDPKIVKPEYHPFLGSYRGRCEAKNKDGTRCVSEKEGKQQADFQIRICHRTQTIKMGKRIN